MKFYFLILIILLLPQENIWAQSGMAIRLNGDGDFIKILDAENLNIGTTIDLTVELCFKTDNSARFNLLNKYTCFYFPSAPLSPDKGWLVDVNNPEANCIFLRIAAEHVKSSGSMGFFNLNEDKWIHYASFFSEILKKLINT
jgi:hypothetical protein